MCSLKRKGTLESIMKLQPVLKGIQSFFLKPEGEWYKESSGLRKDSTQLSYRPLKNC